MACDSRGCPIYSIPVEWWDFLNEIRRRLRAGAAVFTKTELPADHTADTFRSFLRQAGFKVASGETGHIVITHLIE